jgi:hypothetical protein
LGKNRCPNCGKRVPEYELCCSRCGHSVPIPLADSAGRIDSTLDDGDEWTEDGFDGIDDPDLLEYAEAAVRALPLAGLSAIAGTYKYTPAPDFTAGRAHATGDKGTEDDEATDGDEVAVGGDAVAGEIPEPVPTGGECPVCGRQAQKGWQTCPWCGGALPG